MRMPFVASVWPGGIAFVCVALACSACESTGTVQERFDATSGVTWTVARQIGALARTEARYSRSARDYLYLGPVAVNRRGTVEYFLWVGVATTLDRGFLAPPAEAPSRLVVYVQGEPIEFELEPWVDRVPELRGIQAYVPPVAVRTQWAARVTRDQLRMLSDATIDSIEISGEAGGMRPFFPWEPWIGWPTFFASELGLR